MYNNKLFSKKQENWNEQVNDSNFGSFFSAVGAGAEALGARRTAYLTNTDKSDSKESFASVEPKVASPNSASNSDDYDSEYFLKRSLELFNETKNLFNHDKKALRQIHALGFQRLRKINEDTIVIYSNFNRIGNSNSGWQLAQEMSDSDKARFASKNLAQERALANVDVWAYFATLTFDASKQDRNDFHALLNRTTNFFRRRGIKYFMIPELHQNGGIHFHALLSKEIEPYLSDFAETAPKALNNHYIKKKLAEGAGIKNCALIAEIYGYNIIEPIRNADACVQYLTKYVLKTFDNENFERISRRRFFISKGLKHPEIVLPNRIDLENFNLVALSSHTQKIYLKRKGLGGVRLASMVDYSFRASAPPFSLKQNRTATSPT
ncbi:MAG: hypothetical protein IJQ34_05685 [Kiritimatiellae bacterium]|nr:hypothetical protein [Kiritimatiellia bacterium]